MQCIIIMLWVSGDWLNVIKKA